MRKVWIHSFLREDGARVPYRVSSHADCLLPYDKDDRIEEGWFVTPYDLEMMLKDAFEAARKTSFLWYVHDTFDAWVAQRLSVRCALADAVQPGERK